MTAKACIENLFNGKAARGWQLSLLEPAVSGSCIDKNCCGLKASMTNKMNEKNVVKCLTFSVNEESISWYPFCKRNHNLG
jgi:hypothetical protein